MDRRRREETRKDHHQNGPPDPKLDLTIITAVVGTRVLFEKFGFTAVAEFVFSFPAKRSRTASLFSLPEAGRRLDPRNAWLVPQVNRPHAQKVRG